MFTHPPLSSNSGRRWINMEVSVAVASSEGGAEGAEGRVPAKKNNTETGLSAWRERERERDAPR